MLMTIRCFVCLLVLGITGFAQQVPDPGTVTGNTYTNDFFHFTYTIPDGWSVHTDKLAAELGHSSNKALLFAKKAPENYAAVTIYYRDVSASAPFDVNSFLDGLQTASATRDGKPVGNRGRYTLGGRPFMRQDIEFTPTAHYLSSIVGVVRGYALIFTLQADSQTELEDLVRTVTGAKFAPDWSSGVPAGQGCPNLRTDASGKPIVERIRVSGGVQEGLLLTKENPRYPADARQKHIQGRVIMTALIGCDGRVRALSVVSGPPVLIDATLDPVSRWMYRPYILNGKPIEVETTITVNFELR